ncbi:MAG: lysophospholipase [Eggerthellaceae bacterium]|jgi:alpha-beta hydrolase superfamily lysophospholipase|nr:lysophospholipase [Eggerthellaceae bacterium]MCH4221038.1 lysophospholipase [Eggerthellaceae bacterium]
MEPSLDQLDATSSIDEQGICCSEFYYLSEDHHHRIRALLWTPPAKHPSRAIVQIVHGMSEHIDRYDDFARFLALQGFTVCGNDHIGHGKSVDSDEELGCLPARTGARLLVEDVARLRRICRKHVSASLPYIMFGHSMGSFIVRAYLPRYGRGLAGAIISGTAQQPLLLSRVGGFISRRIVAHKGEDYRSSLLDRLGAGSYANKIPNRRTDFDWLSTDPSVVDSYCNDPKCGVAFSAGGYAALTDLTAEIVSDACAVGVPDNLPVLFIGGACDPVGDNGRGVQAAADAMRTHSKAHVSVIIYKGMRHEVLNEKGHERVYHDVVDWINQAV